MGQTQRGSRLPMCERSDGDFFAPLLDKMARILEDQRLGTTPHPVTHPRSTRLTRFFESLLLNCFHQVIGSELIHDDLHRVFMSMTV